MIDELAIFRVLQRHGVPFVIIGGHAVNIYGYIRTTEDSDVVWVRSPETEKSLLDALKEINADYIGNDIDPSTGIERTYPVSLSFIQSRHLMMLWTKHGFLDLFDYIPSFPNDDVRQILETSVEVDGFRIISLPWLRKLKIAADRPKDRVDLDHLPQ